MKIHFFNWENQIVMTPKKIFDYMYTYIYKTICIHKMVTRYFLKKRLFTIYTSKNNTQI